MEKKTEGRYVWITQEEIERVKDFLDAFYDDGIEPEKGTIEILELFGVIELLREISEYED